MAGETIPCGEELASVVNEQVMTLGEWMHFMFESPEICLESEMQWPVN